MKDTHEVDSVAIPQSFRALQYKGCQEQPFLHLSTHPGIQLHPDGQHWKTNPKNVGMMGKATYEHWKGHRQAICHDEEASFSVPPLRPSTLSCIPFKPHCSPRQCVAGWPPRHLPYYLSFSVCSFLSSPASPQEAWHQERSRQGFDFTHLRGKRFELGVECKFRSIF